MLQGTIYAILIFRRKIGAFLRHACVRVTLSRWHFRVSEMTMRNGKSVEQECKKSYICTLPRLKWNVGKVTEWICKMAYRKYDYANRTFGRGNLRRMLV